MADPMDIDSHMKKPRRLIPYNDSYVIGPVVNRERNSYWNSNPKEVDYGKLKLVSLDEIYVDIFVKEGKIKLMKLRPGAVVNKKQLFDACFYLIHREMNESKKDFKNYLSKSTWIYTLWAERDMFFDSNVNYICNVGGKKNFLIGFILFKKHHDFIEIHLLVADRSFKKSTFIKRIGSFLLKSVIENFQKDIYLFPVPGSEGFYKWFGFKDIINHEIRIQMQKTVIYVKNEVCEFKDDFEMEGEFEYLKVRPPLYGYSERPICCRKFIDENDYCKICGHLILY